MPGELREKDASISVFQTTNATLQQQLDALQRQLASPEATTPSFVAKQRQQLAAAASAQAGLQSENMQLRQELLELRLALEAAGGGGMGSARGASTGGGKGRQEQDGEEDALAAAERLLSGDDDGGDGDAPGAGDWKVQEIERLQDENRQLQDKVGDVGRCCWLHSRLQASSYMLHTTLPFLAVKIQKTELATVCRGV
jgi:hypothetical protein